MKELRFMRAAQIVPDERITYIQTRTLQGLDPDMEEPEETSEESRLEIVGQGGGVCNDYTVRALPFSSALSTPPNSSNGCPSPWKAGFQSDYSKGKLWWKFKPSVPKKGLSRLSTLCFRLVPASCADLIPNGR